MYEYFLIFFLAPCVALAKCHSLILMTSYSIVHHSTIYSSQLLGWIEGDKISGKKITGP